MKKNTASDRRSGLLDNGEATRLFRSKFNVETADIPNPVLDEPVDRESETSFLRSQRRVPVRRRGGSRFGSRFGLGGRWLWLLKGILFVAILFASGMVGLAVKAFLLHSSRFILQSPGSIQVDGNRVVSTSQALAFFAPDMGRSVLRVPIDKRKAELESIQWVRTATVMRLWPNHVRVALVERSPVAFALDGNAVRLVDDQGVLLNLPNAVSQHYSFPVLTGISASNPLPIRATRMAMYLEFVHALDADGGHVSSTLSQVDLSDPEDIRAIFLGGARQPQVRFGDSNYLARYQAYQAHLSEWLQQYPQLRSVDMRYGRQVVLDTGSVAADTVAPGPSEPLDQTTASSIAKAAAGSATASHPKATSRNKASTAKPTAQGTKQAAPKRHGAKLHAARTTRHSSKKRSRRARHVPERGHPVRHPIMHVVSGM